MINTQHDNTTVRIPSTLLFNALNGLFVLAVGLPKDEYGPVHSAFIARYMDFDINRDHVEGQLIIHEDGSIEDDFKILDQDELPPVVTEQHLNRQAEYKITKRYPLVNQINILSRLVKRLADEASIDTEELDEMLDYMQLCIDTNKAQKEFYNASPEVRYISDDDAANKQAAIMEGGIHEMFGARPVTDGRIFRTDS